MNATPDAAIQWAGRISAAWRVSVDGILEVAHLLAKAHEDLKLTPKAWATLTGRKYPQILPFKWNAAERMKLIGEDERIVEYTQQLPPDWECIYLLTTLKGEHFERALRTGVVHPGMKQADVRKFKRLLRSEQEQAVVSTIRSNFQIHHCSIDNVGVELLADASVDAVITDPPYPPQFLPTFSLLADFAERVLKPGGWCIVMTGAVFLPEVLNRLATKLTYRWQYIITTPGGANARIGSLGLFQGYKPVLLFQKPPIGKIREWWSDVISAKAGDQDKSLHRWQQSENVFTELVNRFSRPGDLIVDPFAGSGTTGRAAVNSGRHFWGCDVDANCSLGLEAAE